MTGRNPDIVKVFEPDTKSMRGSSISLVVLTVMIFGPLAWFAARSASASLLNGTLPALLCMAWIALWLMQEIEERFGVTVLTHGTIERRSMFRTLVLPASELAGYSPAGYSNAPTGAYIYLHLRDNTRPPVLVDRRVLDEREQLDWLMALPNLGYGRLPPVRRQPGAVEWLPTVASALAWVAAIALLLQVLAGASVAAWVHALSVSAAWSICMLTRGQARLTTTSSIDDPRVSFWPAAFSPFALVFSSGDALRQFSFLECQLIAVAATLLLVAMDARLRNDFASMIAHMIFGAGIVLVIRTSIG